MRIYLALTVRSNRNPPEHLRTQVNQGVNFRILFGGIMDDYESNFDNSALYECEAPVQTFDDFSSSDFGDVFGRGFNY